MDASSITSLINLGSAGAVIIVVYYFLKFVRERDKDWRDFFTSIRASDALSNSRLLEAFDRLVIRIDGFEEKIDGLENKFDAHDATEMEFLRGIAVQAAQDRKTQPRRKPGD